MTFLRLISMKIAMNLIINFLLLFVPYFFSNYNNIKVMLSVAIIITQAPRWQNITIKRIFLILPGNLTAYSLV
jgi:hypothetical protein